MKKITKSRRLPKDYKLCKHYNSFPCTRKQIELKFKIHNQKLPEHIICFQFRWWNFSCWLDLCQKSARFHLWLFSLFISFSFASLLSAMWGSRPCRYRHENHFTVHFFRWLVCCEQFFFCSLIGKYYEALFPFAKLMPCSTRKAAHENRYMKCGW